MTVEEIAERGDWCKTGNIVDCNVSRCRTAASNYAVVRTKDADDTWFFCDEHFMEYLRKRDELREKEREP
jgi:hypothetical protein